MVLRIRQRPGHDLETAQSIQVILQALDGIGVVDIRMGKHKNIIKPIDDHIPLRVEGGNLIGVNGGVLVECRKQGRGFLEQRLELAFVVRVALTVFLKTSSLKRPIKVFCSWLKRNSKPMRWLASERCANAAAKFPRPVGENFTRLTLPASI